jgi:hypothetical protein
VSSRQITLQRGLFGVARCERDQRAIGGILNGASGGPTTTPEPCRWCGGVWSGGGAVVAAGIIGLTVAPSALADDTTVDVNGWAVQTDGSDVSPATLIDPSDSLGNGTQVTGSFDGVPYALDHSESVQIFD